jgi:hypothetical protein
LRHDGLRRSGCGRGREVDEARASLSATAAARAGAIVAAAQHPLHPEAPDQQQDQAMNQNGRDETARAPARQRQP